VKRRRRRRMVVMAEQHPFPSSFPSLPPYEVGAG